MKKLLFVCCLFFALAAYMVEAGVTNCGSIANKPPKPAKKVTKEDVKVENDYDKVIAPKEGEGVHYLTVVSGDSPKPNKCGLLASNDPAKWAGWGGPLDCDNCSIGEGKGTRNEIVIGGTYFPRGIGTHGMANYTYDLTGAAYAKFEGYVGMSDEKDPTGCNHGGTSTFAFKVDGKDAFKSDTIPGSKDGKNVAPVKVEFDIPTGAKKLEIEIGDGGDGVGCDHSALGDAKLLTAQATTDVEADQKLPTSWADIKSSY